MKEKLLTLDGLDGYQFEELIAKIMKKKGMSNIKITKKSRDVGKDIIMEDSEDNLVLVECKHQNFVGRPIIQKLQGAINHEEQRNQNRNVRGIIVTSGNFSKEALEYNEEIGQNIELIDGTKLKEICKELKLVILNGKVQVLINESFKNISKNQSKDLINKNYSKIYWSKEHKPNIKSNFEFIPVCYIKYLVKFDTNTSVGCIDSYSSSGEIAVDGVTGNELNNEVKDFFFSSKIDIEQIKDEYGDKKIPFEFTENDIEERAINSIIEEHTHSIGYTGNNNVSYVKECIPKRRDIDIKKFVPIYLPYWDNNLIIKKMRYNQKFYVKGSNQFYTNDHLLICKICEKEKSEYEDMNVCPDCGRIVCNRHRKIDYFDKETPICTLHAKPFKLWLQNRYFAKIENRNEYKRLWESKNLLERLYEDKIVLTLIVIFIILSIILISS
ncbi:restriction endonuclease [Candidatus Woesearchaeota archaeon]|nr:restriction endonuclease [Candidatus Woesearchaeota archaeon]